MEVLGPRPCGLSLNQAPQRQVVRIKPYPVNGFSLLFLSLLKRVGNINQIYLFNSFKKLSRLYEIKYWFVVLMLSMQDKKSTDVLIWMNYLLKSYPIPDNTHVSINSIFYIFDTRVTSYSSPLLCCYSWYLYVRMTANAAVADVLPHTQCETDTELLLYDGFHGNSQDICVHEYRVSGVFKKKKTLQYW